MKEINPAKLLRELEAAGLPVVGVCVDGRIDYCRDLTEVEELTEARLVDAHDPEEAPIPTIEERLAALEKKVFGDQA